MKNNEILISVKFESETMEKEMSFLLQKDISLKSLIEGLYYGLKKASRKDSSEKTGELSILKCFQLFEDYIETHSQLLVLYTSMGDNLILDFTKEAEDSFEDDAFEVEMDFDDTFEE